MRKKRETDKFIALNRRARHEYEILEEIEAGLVLMGSEVKSLRDGKANITESYAGEKDGELYLINAHINEYPNAKIQQHEPRRMRKLLLHKRERDKLIGMIQKKGLTLVALSLYFNARGMAKCKIGVGKGKKLHDKRADKKDKAQKREMSRAMKGH